MDSLRERDRNIDSHNTTQVKERRRSATMSFSFFGLFSLVLFYIGYAGPNLFFIN